MKIRNGFVSNSSSSSFVVIFPREPKSSEDVKNMLFNEDETLYGAYDQTYPVEQVAQTVWNDICGQKKNDFEYAKEEFEYGNIDCFGAPNYSDFRHIKDHNEQWEAYESAQEQFAKLKMKEFFNIRKLKLQKINNEDSFEETALYTFEYSDNDGSYGSALEHGGLFDKLKSVRISKH